MYSALATYLALEGEHYQASQKAGPLAVMMEDFRSQGQAARQVFTRLAQAFQAHHPDWDLHRTSQWMNQAQVLRPHFWAYLQAEGTISEPMMALRLYGKPEDFGVSLEVSFLERKKDDLSLAKQARVLSCEIESPLYYLVQGLDCSQQIQAGPGVRQQLEAGIHQGQIRKVLVKGNVDLTRAEDEGAVLDQLDALYQLLEPVYQATKGLL